MENQNFTEKRFMEVSDMTKSWRRPEDLDNFQEERILQLLDNHGKWILKKDPGIFKNMVGKANWMIKSKRYIRVIQKMASLYKTITDKTTEGPLECLVTQIDDHAEELCADQNNLLSLVQILTEADNNIHAMTKCLWVLTMNSRYGFHTNYVMEWTEELFSTMKLLLEKGADPTWIPSKVLEMEREHRLTAQLKFFLSAKFAIAFKNHLFSPLMNVLTLFLSHKQSNRKKLWGTILHAVLDIDWKWLIQQLEHLPTEFFQQFKQIISKVIEHDPALIDGANYCGNTPLQFFLSNIMLHESTLSVVRDIVFHVKSENNISNRNNSGRTVVHCLAEAFSSLDKPVSQDRQAVFLDLAQCLASATNMEAQDDNGQTALHLLAVKYNDVQQQGLNVFWDLVLRYATASNINIQNNQGGTVLHILAEKYRKNIQEHCHEIFWENFKRLVTKTNINIKDKQGCTVLHILMEKLIWDTDFEKLIMPHLQTITTATNVNAQDKESVTPYSWILRGKLGHQERGSDASGIFFEIEEILLRNGANADLAITGFPFIHSVTDQNPEVYTEEKQEEQNLSA